MEPIINFLKTFSIWQIAAAVVISFVITQYSQNESVRLEFQTPVVEQPLSPLAKSPSIKKHVKRP